MNKEKAEHTQIFLPNLQSQSSFTAHKYLMLQYEMKRDLRLHAGANLCYIPFSDSF